MKPKIDPDLIRSRLEGVSTQAAASDRTRLLHRIADLSEIDHDDLEGPTEDRAYNLYRHPRNRVPVLFRLERIDAPPSLHELLAPVRENSRGPRRWAALEARFRAAIEDVAGMVPATDVALVFRKGDVRLVYCHRLASFVTESLPRIETRFPGSNPRVVMDLEVLVRSFEERLGIRG